MKTLAEGIETQQQLDQLRSEGCDEGQGYLFSRPVPADQTISLLGLLPQASNAA
jgi:EAL domain-containing protein (putative c-di-GMP-specific phosphodiesterase class I)